MYYEPFIQKFFEDLCDPCRKNQIIPELIPKLEIASLYLKFGIIN